MLSNTNAILLPYKSSMVSLLVYARMAVHNVPSTKVLSELLDGVLMPSIAGQKLQWLVVSANSLNHVNNEHNIIKNMKVAWF